MNFDAVGSVGTLHLVVFALWVPLLAWGSARRIDRLPLPPRKRYYLSVLVQQTLFGAFSLWVAYRLGIHLFPRPSLTPLMTLAGAVVLGLAVVLLYPRWVKAIAERNRRVFLVSPRDGVERALWAAVSLAAGVIEEISYRGVLYWVVWQLTGSVTASVAICSIAFGLGHLVQGWAAAAIITGFAAGFHGLVIASGSLYPAMAVHFIYDLIAGFSYGRLAERHGLPLEPPPPIGAVTDSPARSPS
jgi:membrane protease YdiL (CAAX protease family)